MVKSVDDISKPKTTSSHMFKKTPTVGLLGVQLRPQDWCLS